MLLNPLKTYLLVDLPACMVYVSLILTNWNLMTWFVHRSRSRKEAVLGFQNGAIRVYLLVDKKDFSRLGPHWTRCVHDHDYGDISSVAYSYDDRYVFSTGLDGNFFVYQTAETHRYTFGASREPIAIIPAMVAVRSHLHGLKPFYANCCHTGTAIKHPVHAGPG